MDLSKSYDTLPHDLLVAKLEAYNFSVKALTLVLNYLSNRFHRVKLEGSFSDYLKVYSGVPQRSILGPSII